ncbi:hypothetical protein LXL04_020974 [Taraxacum kok-saghyz]
MKRELVMLKLYQNPVVLKHVKNRVTMYVYSFITEYKHDDGYTNGVFGFDKQEVKEVDEREANGEISGCDGLAPGGGESDLCVGLEDEVSSSPLLEQEEKEVVSLILNLLKLLCLGIF